MRHARQDYNGIQDATGKIPQDEPVFVLRGQDPLAPKMLRTYAKRLKKNGGDKKMVKLVKEWADVMDTHQTSIHTHIPDLPHGNPDTVTT